MVDRVANFAAVAFVAGKKLRLKCLEGSAQNWFQLVKFIEQETLKSNKN